ncbi:hypothetical protein MATL_G00009960 [Megalops atlanticus]|uniref:Fibronectin type-III domain-containing protein n=1 Tax=Megalops atlanticus TaxID=7932 RepID=A0A9D3TJM3_MEGAT|nr:hypothetical protein MATL_G00009960 [Megalops atlanticus]
MYFFIVVFTQFVSRIPHALSGNLNCVNDFEATMACVLTYDKHVNCSGYNLVLVPSLSNKNYVCTLTENSSNSYSPFKCGCTVQIPKPITGDEYTANLLKGLNTVNSVKIKPSEKIKPKAPVIISVNRTDTGNFNVTWKTNYLESTPFSESLKTQLSYKMKGDSDEVAKTINATLPFQEILGTELKANRDYVIKARSFSMKFNSQFSDWSQEVEWTNPVSTQDLLKIVIPVLCLLLIINICVCHRCYMKLKASCDKIPDPAKAPLDKIIPTNVKVLQPPKDPPISPIDVFSMEKPCKHLLSEGSSVPVETDPGYKSHQHSS